MQPYQRSIQGIQTTQKTKNSASHSPSSYYNESHDESPEFKLSVRGIEMKKSHNSSDNETQKTIKTYYSLDPN